MSVCCARLSLGIDISERNCQLVGMQNFRLTKGCQTAPRLVAKIHAPIIIYESFFVTHLLLVLCSLYIFANMMT